MRPIHHASAVILSSFVLALCLLGANAGESVAGEPCPGLLVRVIRAVDGDTLTASPVGRGDEVAKWRWRVRLLGIDAPERGGPGAAEATRNLARLAKGRDACLLLGREPADRYGRLLADVRIGGESLSLSQVRAGLARVFRRYLRNVPKTLRAALLAAEEEARREKRGLLR